MNRTIEAPGVEIVEIDRSEYTRTLTGTRVLVPGFAAKGETYQPQQFTSQMAWVNHYGEPTNEAERYFYAACMEVLKQGGILYSCKLPYDNESTDQYVAKNYSLGTSATISSLVDAKQELAESLHGTCYCDEECCDPCECSCEFPFYKVQDFQEFTKDIFLNSTKLDSTEKLAVINADTTEKAMEVIAGIYDSHLTAEWEGTKIPGYDGVISSICDLCKAVFDQLASKNQILTWMDQVEDKEKYEEAFDTFKEHSKFSELNAADNTIKTRQALVSDGATKISLQTVDAYVTGEAKPKANSFVIVDRLGGALGKASTKDETGTTKECVGIVPVITTAANALYFQELIETGKKVGVDFNAISSATTLSAVGKQFTMTSNDTAVPFGSVDVTDESVSKLASKYFPAIGFKDESTFETEHLRKIGVVVFRAFVDPTENNLISFETVESYVGELDPKAVDPATGVTTFIDTLVNSQSEYIYFFSNCFTTEADKKKYEGINIFTIENQDAGALGFFPEMLKKNISVNTSILKGLETVFQKNEDIHEKAIDIVLDAGVSNIAQYIKTLFNDKAGEYDPTGENGNLFKLKSKADTQTWLATIQKLDDFCKLTRKDCMFICDGLRPFCLQGSKKIVRPSKPTNTIDSSILPNMKYLAGMNTNYGAGYCDWFELADDFTGNTFWCPPSIQACGCYIYTDSNYNYWNAPAGQKRGVITALDCAFSPSIKQAGSIYTKGWNYAIDYADVGLILEGQKTLQQKATAFDRVNVRRLFLRLERATYNIARSFVYEQNTAYTRQRLVDMLDPIFANCQALGGCYDYRIICDETINTPEVIDNNELRVKIGVKPTKTAEFIMIQFYALRTNGSWDEMTAEG